MAFCRVLPRGDRGWPLGGFFVLHSNGLLMAHTSVGNYAFRWKAYGGDFRAFLVRVVANPGYLLEKFARRELVDVEESRRVYRERVRDLHSRGCQAIAQGA